MTGVAVAAVSAAVATGALSLTVVLDLVSMWPWGVAAVVAAAAVWPRRRRSPRLLAIPGLLVLTWLVLGVALHLSGWPPLPSSAGDVAGPAGIGMADLTVTVDSGRLVVAGSEQPAAYRLRPLRRGGPTGLPSVSEGRAGATLAVVITEDRGAEWFRFEGWRLDLSGETRWTLRLGADQLQADLAGLEVDDLEVAARAGIVEVGAAVERSTMRVEGTVVVDVPPATPVRVAGRATVPEGWEATVDGWRAPVEGVGWAITVAEGATVEIRTR